MKKSKLEKCSCIYDAQGKILGLCLRCNKLIIKEDEKTKKKLKSLLLRRLEEEKRLMDMPGIDQAIKIVKEVL